MMKIQSRRPSMPQHETLGARILSAIDGFVLNHALLFIGLFVVAVGVLEFYHHFLKINRNTDHIDIVKKYVTLKLLRRHGL